MPSDITVLNFDNVYRSQSFLNKASYDWIDLQQITNASLYCEKESLRKIAKEIEKYRSNKITLIGSGNYHYVSYLYLAKIKAPFTLVLFDHHTDSMISPSDDLISCGSWVYEAIKHFPLLKKVIIVGVNENNQHIPPEIKQKISIYTKHFIHFNFKKARAQILEEIQTNEVYISIDKDVLDKKDAITAWDHGNMRLRELLVIVKEIIKEKSISGIDVCGEYPTQSTNEFGQQTKEAHKKNSYANQFILHHITRWLEQSSQANEILHA